MGKIAQVIDFIKVILIYFFSEIRDNDNMKREDTDAQVKAHIITQINKYRDEAVHLGFDYPTEPIENSSVIDLLNFLEEIVDYVAYNYGFNAAINGEELEIQTTH